MVTKLNINIIYYFHINIYFNKRIILNLLDSIISLCRNKYLFANYAILTHPFSASRCSQQQPQPNSCVSKAKALFNAFEKFARGPFGLSTASECYLFLFGSVCNFFDELFFVIPHRRKPQTALASCLKLESITQPPLPPPHALSLSKCANLFILNVVIHYDECVVVSIIGLQACPTYPHTYVCIYVCTNTHVYVICNTKRATATKAPRLWLK